MKPKKALFRKSFEWKKIEQPSGPIEYVLRSGNLDCNHNYVLINSFEDYSGQCCVCSECGQVETSHAVGDVSEFHEISGFHVVESDNTPDPYFLY